VLAQTQSQILGAKSGQVIQGSIQVGHPRPKLDQVSLG